MPTCRHLQPTAWDSMPHVDHAVEFKDLFAIHADVHNRSVGYSTPSTPGLCANTLSSSSSQRKTSGLHSKTYAIQSVVEGSEAKGTYALSYIAMLSFTLRSPKQ